MAEEKEPSQNEGGIRQVWSEACRIYNDGVPEPRERWLGGLLVIIVISAALIWWRGFPDVPSSPNDRTPFYYLLSTQSQVLGAILALVLTLSLVAAQLATRYAHRAFTQVFGKWLWVYVLLYLFGITLPLFLLMGNFTLLGVRLSLLLATVCLASLIPYFVTLKRRLTLEFIILTLSETAILGYQSRPSRAMQREAPSALQILNNIAMGAFQAHDFDSFDMAVHALSFVAKRLTTQPTSDASRDSAEDILNRLQNTGLRVLDDPSAPSSVMDAIASVGRAAAPYQVALSSYACHLLKALGESAATKGRDQVVSYAIHSLRSIGMELIANGAGDAYINSVFFDLRVLCVNAARQKLGDPAYHAPTELGSLAATVAEQGREMSVHQGLSELNIMARVLLENDLSAPFSAIAFAAGRIGKTCINHLPKHADLRFPGYGAAETLWVRAACSRSRWNDGGVNSAFIQNLEELAALPNAKQIVEQAYTVVQKRFQEPTSESKLVAALAQVKHEFDDRISKPPIAS